MQTKSTPKFTLKQQIKQKQWDWRGKSMADSFSGFCLNLYSLFEKNTAVLRGVVCIASIRGSTCK